MPITDHIVRCAYRGVEFPCTEFKDSRGHAHKAHTAWRVPGADIETTGREPLKISLKAGLLNGMTGGWPADLFPGLHDRLESAFLDEPQGTFQHPYYGPIEVQVISWERSFDHACQQGVTLDIELLENNASAYWPVAIAQQEPASGLVAAADEADTAVEALGEDSPGLADTVDTQLAYLEDDDRTAAQASAALAEIQTVASASLDSAALAGVEGHDARAALRATLAMTYEYESRYLVPRPTARTHVVTARMSLARIAALIYGDPNRAADLRRANALADELFVPVGTVIVVPSE